MFACFPLLLRELPGCTTFKLGPFALSDRPFYYITGLQLAVRTAPQGWAALCGLAAGTLYLAFGRRAFSVPGPIAKCARTLCSVLTVSITPGLFSRAPCAALCAAAWLAASSSQS
eukprot:COSAG02_NODE_1923_length_10327_cov_6.211501_12_plen_115_part_00